MTLKITNDFNLILNENDYQAFVASIDLLSLHCPVCGAVDFFILYKELTIIKKRKKNKKIIKKKIKNNK